MNGSTWITTHGSRQLDQLVELRAHDRGTAHHVPQHALVQDVPEHRWVLASQDRLAFQPGSDGTVDRRALSCGLPALMTAYGNALLEATTYHLGMSADAHEKPDIFVPADVVADPGDASAAWGRALKELHGDKQRFDSWRKQRYAFAHRVGSLLTEAHPPTGASF